MAEEVKKEVETTEASQVVEKKETKDLTGKALIEALASEIHPGNWDLGDVELGLYEYLVENYIDGLESCGECEYCEEGEPEECENSYGTPKEDLRRLLIRFPAVTMTNSRERTHDIKDVYIAIIFNDSYTNLVTRTMFLIRSTVTTKEYSSGYMHSHATTTGRDYSSVMHYFRWRELCLGGDTELTDITYNLRDGVDYRNMHELLVLLHLYVGWESVEGGPYMHMSDVKYTLSDNIRDVDFGDLAEQLGKEIIKNYNSEGFEDMVRPNIIGTAGNFAITNVNESIGRFAKHLLLKKLQEEDKKELLQCLVLLLPDGTVQPIYDTSSRTKYQLEYYQKVVEVTKSISDKHSILYWQNTPVPLIMELDERGLSLKEEITNELLIDSTVDDELLTDIVSEILYYFTTFYRLKTDG